MPFSEEFDGHDHGATHVIASLGEETIGAVRVRWFRSFAMMGRLAVLPCFRSHHVWQQLLEHCRSLAGSCGCTMLYAQVLPFYIGYWEKQGRQRLVPETQGKAARSRIIALIRAVDPAAPLPESTMPEAIALRRESRLDGAAMPPDACTN